MDIYTIDGSKINKIRNRSFLRGLKILGVTLVLMLCMMYPQRQVYFQPVVAYGFLGGGLLCVIILYVGTSRVKQNYKSLKLILDDEGVEFKASMKLDKKIQWNNLMVEEDSNGIINLYDKSVSLFQRKFNGKGWIIVQPEIMNRDNLKMALVSRSLNYRDL